MQGIKLKALYKGHAYYNYQREAKQAVYNTVYNIFLFEVGRYYISFMQDLAPSHAVCNGTCHLVIAGFTVNEAKLSAFSWKKFMEIFFAYEQHVLPQIVFRDIIYRIQHQQGNF